MTPREVLNQYENELRDLKYDSSIKISPEEKKSKMTDLKEKIADLQLHILKFGNVWDVD